MAGAATLQDASAALEAYLQRCCDDQGGEGAGRVPQAWDDKLQAVRTAVAAAAAGGAPCAAALAREAQPQYQRSLAQRFMEGGGNHVAYLPLGGWVGGSLGYSVWGPPSPCMGLQAARRGASVVVPARLAGLPAELTGCLPRARCTRLQQCPFGCSPALQHSLHRRACTPGPPAP